MVASDSVIELIILQVSVAFSPGLIIALIVNESVQKSRKNGLEVATGAAAGAIFITIITAGIVTFIFNLIPQILTMIYIVGIIYIVYKGIVTIKAEIKINDTNINEGSFNAGMKLNLINPKMWVFYLSVLPIFVTENENVFTQLIILGAITIFVNLIADISYAYMSSYFFQDSSVKTKKVINAVSGFCLILIGIYLFFSRFL
ncbi:MAG: LysE family translocator [Candidatus Actinomarina sp.]|jgi:cysteine/O-acetylserine efflux protein|tara:strand:- start:1241 stop:1846 length:606 start_codon:yes stop_codon:yes gene_type:complete